MGTALFDRDTIQLSRFDQSLFPFGWFDNEFIVESNNPVPEYLFYSDWETTALDILEGGKWLEHTHTPQELFVTPDVSFLGTQSLYFNSDNAQANYLYAPLTNGGDIGIRFFMQINAFFEYYNSYIMYARGRNNASYGQILEFGGDCNAAHDCNSAVDNSYLYLWSDGAPNMVVGDITQITMRTKYQVEIRYIQGVSMAWKLWDYTGTQLLYTATLTTGIPDYPIDEIEVGVLEDPGGLNQFYINSYAIKAGDWIGPLVIDQNQTVLADTIKSRLKTNMAAAAAGGNNVTVDVPKSWVCYQDPSAFATALSIHQDAGETPQITPSNFRDYKLVRVKW